MLNFSFGSLESLKTDKYTISIAPLHGSLLPHQSVTADVSITVMCTTKVAIRLPLSLESRLAKGSLRSDRACVQHLNIVLESMLSWKLECARGMTFLHQSGIMNRDFKPSNIMLVSLEPRAPIHCKLVRCGNSTPLVVGVFGSSAHSNHQSDFGCS